MNNTYTWYAQLIKPEWAPPSWLFGPVWSVLYLIIFVSFGYVFWQIFSKKLNQKFLTPALLNLVSNLAFTPIQFGLRNNLLATLDILVVLISLAWFMRVIYPKRAWVSLVNIPYLLWVSFATILQITITVLNF